ncbi:hypothetical protein [Nostoc linckia]|uniref:hypothetical protein n=1 Tax=Nostoc linckia TaxID=92942 RepID=UPI0015D4D790|nr:hypothetical protein [Nostoc linckia]
MTWWGKGEREKGKGERGKGKGEREKGKGGGKGKGERGKGKGKRGKGKGERGKGKGEREKGKGKRGKVSNTSFTLFPLTFSQTTREVHTAYPNRIGCKLSGISVDCEPSTITGSREL